MSMTTQLADFFEDEAELLSELNTGVHSDEAYRDQKGLREIARVLNDYEGNSIFDNAVDIIFVRVKDHVEGE